MNVYLIVCVCVCICEYICCEIISLKKEIFRNFRVKNKHRSSLLDGCTDWQVATDLEHRFVFSKEIALTTQRADIVIWSIKFF